uniref:Retrovirus-related Pol polyprotein from transposon TNT 1-94 n=1 Tax=Tanacetum cinerariifolium TaxID=118510 RepID=A0A6L2NC65_TANCI|nr:retrovirus-related Pol polyprotein from transposon TNT 1-94 [Tanacetum cinerariifolium]
MVVSSSLTDDELTEKEIKQIEAGDQAIQTILLGLPEDIYAAVDSCEMAQEIWLRVQQMMKGSDIGIQEKKANLFNEWEIFTSNDGKSIDSYYHHFLKLMNDLKRNKHFPEKIANPLALMATSNNPYNFLMLNQDQPSFNQNYMQQPMPNPKDITDPTTAMNMELALMAKAFKLNYSIPTNNNQRISSNPRNRQIAQPRMNMGQDRHMQMVGCNGENKFRQYAGQNVGNLNGYNDVQNVRNQVIQHAVQNPRIQNVVQGNANQNLNGNGNLVAARAKGNATGHHADLDEIEEVNANCILMANLQQASTSGTQTDKALVYDSDGSTEHDPPVVHDSEETLQLAQESRQKMKQLNKEIKPANYTKINHLSGGFVSQTAKSHEELYFSNASKTANVSKPISIPNKEFLDDTTPSVARKFINEVKSTIVTLQRAVKHRMTLETHNWSSFAHQELHKIVKDENFPIVNQVDARVQNFEIQCLKEAAKFVGDFKSRAKEADECLAKHKALKLEIEHLLRAVVSQDIMSVVQKASVVDTSNLQTKLEPYKDMQQKIKRLQAQLGDLKGKSKDTSCVSDTLNPLSQKLENKNVELEFQGIPPMLGETHALLKPVTSNSIPTPQESKVRKNDKVIAPEKFRINPFKTSREEKHVPNNVSASVMTKPITVSQPPVITKKVVNSDSNGFSSTGVDNTKTRRPSPRSNTKNDRVPSASKSSRSKNKEVKVEEHHRKLLLSKNKKHMSSEFNNVKLATQNVYSKVVCAMCKKCLISINHDECLLSYVNDMNSHGKKRMVNVSIEEKQKKQKPKVKKPKKVGFIERLATLKPSKPRSFLRWSPTGRMFDLIGKIIASSESESQSNCSKGDNACTSNPLEPTITRFPNSTSLLSRVYFIKELGHNLFSVGQLCDLDLEVAFRRNACFVRNLEGVDLLKGDRSTNLYTINLQDMVSASPVCLMARASSTKSWLWHQRLSHLNFDTINDLAKNDLVSGELDLLFEAMYDDFIGGQPSAAERTIPAAQAQQVRQTSTTSTSIAKTAPTPTNSSSQATIFPNTSQDVDELNSQQQHA